jgi:hypothetical protein
MPKLVEPEERRQSIHTVDAMHALLKLDGKACGLNANPAKQAGGSISPNS